MGVEPLFFTVPEELLFTNAKAFREHVQNVLFENDVSFYCFRGILTNSFSIQIKAIAMPLYVTVSQHASKILVYLLRVESHFFGDRE